MSLLERVVLRATTAAAFLAVSLITGCASDGPSPTAPTTPQRSQLRVSVRTSGEQQDPNGYTIVVNGVTATAIATNATVEVVDLPPNPPLEVGLSGLAQNCWIAGADTQKPRLVSGRTTSIDFAVECFGFRADLGGNMPVGTWRLRSWEFFEDADFSRRAYDLVGYGFSATLMFTASGDSQMDWRSQEGFDIGIVSTAAKYTRRGSAIVSNNTLDAQVQLGTPPLSLLGDPNGPLHGIQHFFVRGDTLVIFRTDALQGYEQVDDEGPYLPATLWSRLTLARRQDEQ